MSRNIELEHKITKILHDERIKIPKVHDVRQKFFKSVTSTMKKKSPDLKIINAVYGYSASHVNIGQIHNIMNLLIKKYHIYDKEAMTIVLEIFVQRLKSVRITRHAADFGKKKDYHQEWYNIYFETKDDCGWYSYKFSVMIKDIRPKIKKCTKVNSK